MNLVGCAVRRSGCSAGVAGWPYPGLVPHGVPVSLRAPHAAPRCRPPSCCCQDTRGRFIAASSIPMATPWPRLASTGSSVSVTVVPRCPLSWAHTGSDPAADVVLAQPSPGWILSGNCYPRGVQEAFPSSSPGPILIVLEMCLAVPLTQVPEVCRKSVFNA